MLQGIRSAARDDEGVGMVLVLAVVGIVTTMMVVATTTAVRSLRSSRHHVSFESALSTAESGVDVVLARSQRTYDVNGSDTYYTPAPLDPTCNSLNVVWPFVTAPTEAQERSWARTQLTTLATNAACRKVTRGGEFVVIKPVGHQAVYAMGWSPRYAAFEAKARILKAEYLFTPYAPSNAILTSGDVTIEASTLVTTAPPADPALASVHSNGSVIVQSGNPTVYGPVSQSSGAAPADSNNFHGNVGGTVTNIAQQPIPRVSALQVWHRQHASSPPGGWYDLCPDGSVRAPDGTSPCNGTSLGTNSWRGWNFDGSGSVPQWNATGALKTMGYSGTYYIHGGNAFADSGNAGDPVPNLTVIAASSVTSCNKVGGNIDWDAIDPAAPSINNLFMLADQDLLTHSNYQAGSASGGTVVSGLFIAGDQVEMETSSSGAYGAVIASDQCDPADGNSLVDRNIVKNPSVYYDPNGQAPFVDIINTTLWLEYGA